MNAELVLFLNRVIFDPRYCCTELMYAGLIIPLTYVRLFRAENNGPTS